MKARSFTPVSLLVLVVLLSATTARACRYNVRDVGFVDLETETYRLYGFVGPETPPESIALLQQLPAAALRDCNVRVEILRPDTPTNHPAFQYLSSGIADARPGAVLVSPDGQALPLALERPGRSFQESLTFVLDEVASSAAREQILRAVSESFAAILLIEGQRPPENECARRAIAGALEAIGDQMQFMPKAVASPPVLIVLDAAAVARERVLLWSLGLEATPTAQPRALALYGRARWIGPVIQGEEIAEPNLTRLLSIIGADCECGLDVAWTLGTRLPVRWDEDRHAAVAKALGFDPESPLVKVEVSRIAGRSGSFRSSAFSYPKVALSDGAIPEPTSGDTPANRLRAVATHHPSPGAPVATALPLANGPSVFSRVLLSWAVLAVVAISAGLFRVWRANRDRWK